MLALAIVGVYAQTLGHSFVAYDDSHYVVNNAELRSGLSGDAVVRAFTTTYGLRANWIPLTALSLQVDFSLWGTDPYGYHLTNLVLHVASTVLLLLVFVRMTGLLWPSAFVAGVFGLHPLHVESVAWVAERKDVLFGLFWMLTLAAHAHYAARPSLARWWLVPLLLCGSLLAKPMAVTLPLVLLLLDLWPLSRVVDRRSFLLCALEKTPLLLLAAAVGVVTLRFQSAAGAVAGTDTLDWIARLANAIDSYRLYLAQSLWPSGLAVFYPYPASDLSAARVTSSLSCLVLVTAGVAYFAASRRYLAVGWSWFLITLLPVIGIIQVGVQARADRYMYLPLVGLAVMLGFAAHDFAAGRRRARVAVGLVGAAILIACAAGTWRQAQYWRDDRALFERALAVTSGNFIAHQQLGESELREGNLDAAERHYAKALALRPGWLLPETGLARLLLERGALKDAIRRYRELLARTPADPEILRGLTSALIRTGRFGDAKRHLEWAVSEGRESAVAYELLGQLLLQRGDPEAALAPLRRASELDPTGDEAHSLLGLALVRSGRIEEAERHHSDALQRRPEWAAAQLGLARVELARGELESAVSRYRRWMGPRPPSAAHRELGSALIALGRFDEAEAHYTNSHFGLGDVARARGDYEVAAQHYARGLELQPGHAEGERDLGLVLAALGRNQRALRHLERARRLGIRSAELEVRLGLVLQQMGRDGDAETHYRRALQLARDHPVASNNLAWLLATSPNSEVLDPAAALALAARVTRRGEGREEHRYDTLAAAQAATGDFAAAEASATRAALAADRRGDAALAAEIRSRLALYQTGKPYVEESAGVQRAKNGLDQAAP